MELSERLQALAMEKAAILHGDAECVAKQHAEGKSTARERASKLFDAGSFMEIDALRENANLVAGCGTVNGQAVYCFAQDFTSCGGAMTRQQARANEELEAYVRQAEQLSVYEEQLRIAHAIHDDAGHAVTALNTISRMCLQLRESDPERYQSLLDEGLALCEQASAEREKPRCSSLREMLEGLRAATTFPVELIVTGEEPPFAGALHEIIGNVCREAFNNTLAHSLADRLTVELAMTPEALSLHIRDNGCFRGPLEKGFGLTEMEENVHRTGGTVAFETEEGAGFGIRAEWSAE